MRAVFPEKCSVHGCDRQVSVRKHQLCWRHYKRQIRHGSPLAGNPLSGELSAFIDRAVASKTDDCIIWPFGNNGVGYGKVYENGTRQYAHRVVCERFYGPPPTAKHQAAHSCGNGRGGCINPAHLRWATPSENQSDRREHGTHNRGERYGAAKLTESDVLKIRALKGKALQKDVAAEFGVSPTTISQIQGRVSWSWLA